MASYPDSVKSFTTKNTGDVVQASHVNDLQDEVNAIEAGLRNGTAPLNSSNSTVARLSVTNGSTLGGTLSVVGGSTFDATMQVVGGSTFTVRPVEPPPHCAKVFLESTYAAASSAASTLSWTAQDILTNSSMHSTTTNPLRLTPQSTGIWAVSAQLTLSAPSAGSVVAVRVEDSSNEFIGYSLDHGVAAGHAFQAHGIKRFDALGGFAKVVLVNVSGGSTFSVSSGVQNSWFSMRKL